MLLLIGVIFFLPGMERRAAAGAFVLKIVLPALQLDFEPAAGADDEIDIGLAARDGVQLLVGFELGGFHFIGHGLVLLFNRGLWAHPSLLGK